MRTSSVRIDVSWRSLFRIAVAAGAVWLALKLTPVLLAIVVGLMLAGAVSPLVARLERHLPRVPAILVVFGGVFGAFGLLAVAVAPSLVRQATGLVQGLPHMRDEAVHWLETHHLGKIAAGMQDVGGHLDLAGGTGWAIQQGRGAVELLAFAASAVFLGLYFLVDAARLRRIVRRVVPHRRHADLDRILEGLVPIVGGYIRGQIITSLAAGVTALVTLLALGVPNALPLALFVALTDALPFVGAILGLLPCLAAAATVSKVAVLVVLGVMLAYQEVESRVIVPRVFGDSLRLPSSVVLLAILAGGILGGVLGALLALPAAATIVLLLRELHVQLPGDGGPASKPPAARVDEVPRTSRSPSFHSLPPLSAP